MNEIEQESALIGQIYDAVLDPSLWTDVLIKSTRFVGGSGASLFSKDTAGATSHIACEYNTDPGYRRLYFDQFVKRDPCAIGQCLAPIEIPTSPIDFIAPDEFIQTRFYREWVRPQGIADFASVTLDKSATGVALFGVFRHKRDGMVDDETRRRMRFIAPHVRRAVLITKAAEVRNFRAAALADTLDGLRAAVFLIDACRRVIHANVAGQTLLLHGDVLRVVGERLVANDAQAHPLLHKAVAAAVDGDIALGAKAVNLPLMGRGGRRYVAHLLPLTSGARRRAGMAHDAAAALFVREAALETASAAEVISKVYKLTPSELRVLLGIVEVGGAPDCAEALGVADSTIKAHLRQLFEKTGCHRQADLVRLVAEFSSPVDAPPVDPGRKRPADRR